MLMLPEIIVISLAVAILLHDLFLGEAARNYLAPLAMGGLALAIFALVRYVPFEGSALGGRFIVDSVAWWFKLSFLLAALLTIALSKDTLTGNTAVKSGLSSGGEFYTILLFTLTGMLFLISARDWVTLYVSLELATIPLFALAAWKRDARGGEAGLKYIILGALASGFILYGIGLLYGLTGTTDLDAARLALRESPLLWLAVGMMTAGVGFKLMIVPFHMWAADVYEGAPTPVTAYLSVASKGAGLAVMFQVFYRVFGHFLTDWGLLIAIFAAVTMTLGNVVAIVQHNIKRFMAFSAVSQAGYLLMGFVGGTPDGVAAMLYYLVIYVVTNMAAFAVIVFMVNETGSEEIEDYRGLAQSNPLVAVAMMVALFSLAGIPPLSGFIGKFFLFSVAAKGGFHWLVGVAAINSTVSLYYYLRIVRQMYIEPVNASRAPIRPSRTLGVMMAATTVGVIALGIVPTLFETLQTQSISWLAFLR